MGRSGRPSSETEPHAKKFKVRDFRKKLWLLILLHEAIHLEHRKFKALKKNVENALVDDEGQAAWFKRTLLKDNARQLIWAARWPAGLAIPCPETVTYAALPEIFRVSADEMSQDVRSFAAAIRHSVLNEMVGFHLRKGGTVDDRIKHDLKLSSPTRLEKALAENLLPEDERVGVRILTRLAFGLFMAPATEFRNKAPPCSYGQPLRFAEMRAPVEWDCFGEGDDWLTRSNAVPKPGRGLTVEEVEMWKDRQRRAVAVLRAFFCKYARGGRGDVYGDSAEAFLEAVRNYYLHPASPQINSYQPPPLFRKYRPPGGGSKGAESPALTSPVYEATGEGENPFAAILHMRLDLKAESVLLHGNFHPPPHDSGEVVFTDLRVSLKMGEDSGPAAFSLDHAAVQALPKGCNVFGLYGIRIQAPDMEKTNSILASGFPVMRIREARSPFDVFYDLVAPLASIRFVAEEAASGAPSPEAASPNMPRPIPCGIVAQYLRARLAPGQAGWSPPQTIELVRHGVFRISDATNNLRSPGS